MHLLKDFGNIIAICSAIFSGVSIIVTVLSMTMEKSLINQQEYVVMKMDIISKPVCAKAKPCKKRVNKIRNGISEICGLDSALIEMIKPRTIPKGLRIECYLYISHTESTDNEYIKLFEEAKSNGTLAECIKNAWKLPSVPNIINLKIQQVKSDNNTSNLLTNTVQMSALAVASVSSHELENVDVDMLEVNGIDIKRPTSSVHVVNDSMIDGEEMFDEYDEKMIVEKETDMGPEPELNGDKHISVDGHVHDTRKATMNNEENQ